MEEKSPARKRVDRLYRVFARSQKNLDEFQAQHEPIFEQYFAVVNERNAALDAFKRSCRETGLSAGPLEISIQRTRVFDGKRLWEIYKNRKDLRDALVKVEYKVNTKAFDRFIQAGEVTPDIANDVVVDIQVTNKILHSPPEIVVG